MARQIRLRMSHVSESLNAFFLNFEKAIIKPPHANPNLRQRDLMKAPPGQKITYGMFYNTNYQPMAAKGKCDSWIGQHPKVPPRSWFKASEDFDSELDTQYSTGGEI